MIFWKTDQPVKMAPSQRLQFERKNHQFWLCTPRSRTWLEQSPRSNIRFFFHLFCYSLSQKFEQGFITDPICLGPHNTVAGTRFIEPYNCIMCFNWANTVLLCSISHSLSSWLFSPWTRLSSSIIHVSIIIIIPLLSLFWNVRRLKSQRRFVKQLPLVVKTARAKLLK